MAFSEKIPETVEELHSILFWDNVTGVITSTYSESVVSTHLLATRIFEKIKKEGTSNKAEIIEKLAWSDQTRALQAEYFALHENYKDDTKAYKQAQSLLDQQMTEAAERIYKYVLCKGSGYDHVPPSNVVMVEFEDNGLSIDAIIEHSAIINDDGYRLTVVTVNNH